MEGREIPENKKCPWYRSIVFKLMCISLFTLLPTVLLFGHLYRTFQKETIQSLSEAAYTRDSQIFDSFYGKIEEVEYNVLEMFSTTNLSLLSDMWDYYDSYERSEKIVKIQDRMQWYRFMEWFVSDLRIYLTQRDVCIHSNYWADMNQEDFDSVDDYFANPNKLIVDHGNVQMYIGDLSQGTVRSHIRSVSRMTISGYKFQELLDKLCDDGAAQAIILIEGRVLLNNIDNEEKLEKLLETYQASKEDSGSDTFEITAGREKFFCSRAGDYNHRIDVITCRSYDDVFEKTRESYHLIPVMILVNALVLFCFFLYVRKYIKKPVLLLTNAFRTMKDGQEEVLIRAHSQDEFDVLYTGFNEMSMRLNKNIRDNYLMKIDLQREQLKQLQAQINPHFLYNTLLLIKIRIRRGDQAGAEKMAGLLSDYFRFMNRNKRDVIPLEEECGCISTYMNIQSERFSNRFEFELEPCPEDIRNLPVPRLLLQPLVENAVKYGMEKIEENGKVRMFFQRNESKVSVVVEETGIDITCEEVAEMNERIQNPPEDGEITSTVNTNRRIKLFYGEEYQLLYVRTEQGALQAIAELDGGKVYEQMESHGGGR